MHRQRLAPKGKKSSARAKKEKIPRCDQCGMQVWLLPRKGSRESGLCSAPKCRCAEFFHPLLKQAGALSNISAVPWRFYKRGHDIHAGTPGSKCGDVGKTKALAHTSGAFCWDYYMTEGKGVSSVIAFGGYCQYLPFWRSWRPYGRCAPRSGCIAPPRIPHRRNR